jgi:hypothetical protein
LSTAFASWCWPEPVPTDLWRGDQINFLFRPRLPPGLSHWDVGHIITILAGQRRAAPRGQKELGAAEFPRIKQP